MKAWQDRAFGMSIRSSASGSEGDGTGAQGDVDIRFGVTPRQLDAPLRTGDWYQVAADEFLFWVPQLARFHVCGGKRITIEADADVERKMLDPYLFGTAIAVLAQQRGMLTIHASAVALRGGGAVLFAGPSGIGKSTLAAAMVQRGHELLSDDLCLVANGDGAVVVFPGLPRQNLSPHALRGLGQPDRRPIGVHGLSGKGVVPVSEGFCERPTPLTRIYVLSHGPQDEVAVTPISGLKRLEAITEQIYRRRIFNHVGDREQRFGQLRSLCAQVSVHALRRPARGCDLGALCRVVEDDLAVVQTEEPNRCHSPFQPPRPS